MKYGATLMIIATILFASCTSDQAMDPDAGDCNVPDEVSFAVDIEPVFTASCAYSGCHIEGFAQGNFTTYEGIQTFLDNSKIQERALNIKDMPPTYAPDDKPQSLDNCQLAFLQSWVDAGYPNN